MFRHTWSTVEALELAKRFAAVQGTTMDHDAAAGESWARVLGNKRTLVYVHLQRPLLLVSPEATVPPRTSRLAVILSFDFDEPIFVAIPASLGQAFPGGKSGCLPRNILAQRPVVRHCIDPHDPAAAGIGLEAILGPLPRLATRPASREPF
jgi:hypothetical protein